MSFKKRFSRFEFAYLVKKLYLYLLSYKKITIANINGILIMHLFRGGGKMDGLTTVWNFHQSLLEF